MDPDGLRRRSVSVKGRSARLSWHFRADARLASGNPAEFIAAFGRDRTRRPRPSRESVESQVTSRLEARQDP